MNLFTVYSAVSSLMFVSLLTLVHHLELEKDSMYTVWEIICANYSNLYVDKAF